MEVCFAITNRTSPIFKHFILPFQLKVNLLSRFGCLFQSNFIISAVVASLASSLESKYVII